MKAVGLGAIANVFRTFNRVRVTSLLLRAAALSLAPIADVAFAQGDSNGAAGHPAAEVEANLLADMLAQPVGRYSVATLGLSDELARRIRDRMLIDVYRRDLIRVEHTSDRPTLGPPLSARACEVRLVRHLPPIEELKQRGAVRPTRPEARGFKADVIAPFEERPANLSTDLSPQWSDAADVFNTRVAELGLLAAIAEVVRSTGPDEFVRDLSAGLDRLRKIGVPTDLLAHFECEGARGEHAVVALIASKLAAGADRESAITGVNFKPSRSHKFQATDEGGLLPIGMVRLQVPSRTLWEPGEPGDLIEALTTLIDACEPSAAIVTVSQTDLKPLMNRLGARPLGAARLTVVEEPLPVAQWGQDTGKSGLVPDETGGWKYATLVPRYCSQNEDGSVFVPNESYMAGGWQAAGHDVIQSGLLFQGGNAMLVQDDAARVLLVGESEIARNTALGLSAAQTEALFASEFDADRCVVLPSASFHLDLDFTVRSTAGRRPVVLFIDEPAGARAIVRAGIGAMKAKEVINAADAERFLRALELGAVGDWRSGVHEALSSRVNAGGEYTKAVCAAFAVDAGDDGEANLRRFIAAADTLEAIASADSERDPVRGAYLRALARHASDVKAMRGAIAALGWRVESVPGLSAGTDGVNSLNGVHDKAKYFAPVIGGLYAELDDLALGSIRRVLGGSVVVVPVPSGALQRRAGGLHCVAAAYRRHE